MKKYAIPGVMLIAGHEVISLIALLVAVCMVISDFCEGLNNRGGF